MIHVALDLKQQQQNETVGKDVLPRKAKFHSKVYASLQV